MVDYDQLKRVETQATHDLSGKWVHVTDVFTDANDQIHHHVFTTLHNGNLSGASIAVAADRASDFKANLAAGSEEAEALGAAFLDFSEDIYDIKRRLTDVETEIADARNLEITENGSVVYHRPTVPADGPASEAVDDASAKAKADMAIVYTSRIAALVAEATATDRDLANKLLFIAELQSRPTHPIDLTFNADPDRDIDVMRAAAMPDNLRSDPDAAAAWWRSQSPDAKDWYIAHEYHTIGATDGLPTVDRHRANMIALSQAVSDGSPEAEALWQSIYDSRTGQGEGGNLYLLGYDIPDGSPATDARVVLSMGNPDTSAHTAVYVPGTGTHIEDVPGRELDRVSALYNEASGLSGAQGVATILWLDYDTPSVATAVDVSRAVDGAPRLDGFVNGLNSAHDDSPSHVTALGHSYGTTVIGQADVMGDGLAVDDMVLVATPGLGPEPDRIVSWDGIDGVEDLHIDGDHVWGLHAADDPIHYTDHFGDTTSSAGFGGHSMYADTSGHSSYWDYDEEGNPSRSLMYQARVIAGDYPG